MDKGTKWSPGRWRPSWIFGNFSTAKSWPLPLSTIPPNFKEFHQAVFRHEPKRILDKMATRLRSRRKLKNPANAHYCAPPREQVYQVSRRSDANCRRRYTLKKKLTDDVRMYGWTTDDSASDKLRLTMSAELKNQE